MTRNKPLRHAFCLRFVGAAVLAVSAVACASKTINQVLADPSRYRNRHVRLSGSVVDSYAVANRWTYRIDDDTGQLWVVSDRGTPRMGARVTINGTIREGFNLGTLGSPNYPGSRHN